MPSMGRNAWVVTGCILLASMLVACGSNNVTVRDSRKTYPPTESVDILNSAPQRAYETLATLTATGDTLPRVPRNRNAVLRQLGDQAKELGADAVILTGEKASVERWGVVYTLTGIAIKYAAATAAPAAGQASPASGQGAALVADPVQVETMGPAASTPAAPAAPAAGGWLAGQSAQHYTIQLLATRSAEAIPRFVEEHGLGNEIGQFITTRDGATWHTLVYGSYPSRDAARAAIKTLPPSLRKSSPWVRRIGDIQALNRP